MLERFDQLAIQRALDPEELVEGLAEAFIALSRGEVVAPPRVQVSTELGYSLSMPVYRAGGPIMVKIVNVFDENVDRGLPSHHALICLFDSETGEATAIVDATGITATRTAAASALSTKLLAREDAKVMTIVGAGVQARAHLELLPLVRDLDEIRIVSRRLEAAQILAQLHPRARAVELAEEGIRSGDIVALCTSSGTAVLDPFWIEPGTHVTSVGYRAPDGELPRGLLDRASLFVESRLAFDPFPVGCFELAGLDPDARHRNGRAPSRNSSRSHISRRDHGLQVDGARR